MITRHLKRVIALPTTILLITLSAMTAVASSGNQCTEVLVKLPERDKTTASNYNRRDVLMSYEEQRDLSLYLEQLGPTFMADLLKVIASKGHILDAGAGFGQAAKELVLPENDIMQFRADEKIVKVVRKIHKLPEDRRPIVTAVTAKSSEYVPRLPLFIDLPSSNVGIPNKLEFFQGRLFEEISNREITRNFGRVDLIIDMWGVFTYSHDLTTVLKKYHSLLKPGGTVHIKVENMRGKTTILEHTVMTKDGSVRLVEDWLPTVKGFTYEYFPEFGVLRLTKNRDKLSVPALTIESSSGEVPPNRVFIQNDET